MNPALLSQVQNILVMWVTSPLAVLTQSDRFGLLLRALHRRHGHPLDEDLALGAAFALVALAGRHTAPVPSHYYVLARGHFLDRGNSVSGLIDGTHLRRAPEFVTAFLTGWERCLPSLCPLAGTHHSHREPLNDQSDEWDGTTRGAAQVVHHLVKRCVRRCIDGLQNGSWYEDQVPAFSRDLQRTAEHRVYHRFLEHLPHGPLLHPTAFLHNRLDTWIPGRMALWHHCERAFQGFVGREFHPDTFLSSLTRQAMTFEPGEQRVQWGPFVRRRCRECGYTSDLTCHGGYPAAREVARGRSYFFLSGLSSQFLLQEFHSCPARPDHIYPARFANCPLQDCPEHGQAAVTGSRQRYRCLTTR